MVEQNVNKNYSSVKDRLKHLISEKKLPKILENKFPKLTYSLLQTFSLVIDESSFWNLSDIVSPIDLIIDLSEERVRSILQQPNKGIKKRPDLTEIYPTFILCESYVDCLSLGKSCCKLGILNTFL